jgi:hypothetical protein
MKKFGKILLIGLSFGLVTFIIGFLTIPPTPVQGAPGPAPVTVVNTPLPVQGTVNANITNATVPVSGTVNASQNGAWNVGVSNFPATQTVSFNGAQPVSFANTSTSPIFTLDVDNNGRIPFQAEFVLDNTNPGTTPGCGITQCQANFDVPNGKRLVLEQVSAKIQGAPGQKYLAFVSGATSATDEPFTAWIELNFQGSFLNNTADLFTANQPVRAYFEETQPPPFVIVTSNNGGSFRALIDIAGYLISQ